MHKDVAESMQHTDSMQHIGSMWEDRIQYAKETEYVDKNITVKVWDFLKCIDRFSWLSCLFKG